ncbi:chemotaxis protein CheB [Actinoplanes sp. NPDC051861]|uniref:chemotaxis protein CheB n=1 Tax=Actinoplanes sp. NPDC051861 TaxID=3155170 RepID=UPI0034298E4C
MEDSADRPGFDVVAMVASAGGLDALTAVLRDLPAGLGAGVLVQQHLGGRASVLPEILRRRVGREVTWAVDGAALAVPGRITISPPRTWVEVMPDGTCGLHTVAPTGGRPHDELLTSLADSFRERALAVVLSGAGTDGADGVAAMIAAGGVVIAQSEDTAEYPSMPRAAAGAGAHLVLPLHEIAVVVAAVVRGRPLPRPPDEVEAIRTTFGEGHEMSRLAHAVDWSQHILGPVRRWPPALRAAVRLAADLPHAAVVYAGDRYVTLFNEGAIPSLGAQYEEAFGRPIFEGCPDVEFQREWFERARAGEPVLLPVQPVPHFRRRAVLTRGWYDLSFTAVRDEHDAVVGLFESVSDRTEQVLASRRLATLSDLAAIPAGHGRREALEAAVACLARAEDVVYATAYLTTASGDAANLVDATGVEAGGPMAPRHVTLRTGTAGWPLGRAVAGRELIVVDDVGRRFRGSSFGPEHREPEAAAVVPLRDQAEDRVAGVLVLGADPLLRFDDRYREFFRAAGETIAAKAAESHARERERHRTGQLAELDRAKTEFFSKVSHEFRTPLTLMLGPLEQLLDRRADRIAEHTAELELVRRNARRLLRMVGTLLDFSQAEAGRLRVNFGPVDLAAATIEIVAMFQSAADAAGLKLTVDAPPLPEPVWVDREMWEKIVSNLVSNALKFTWQGGVEVSLRAQPKHAELSVRDTGAGIPADDQPYIFRRFHRVRDTVGRTHEGAGIGLALVDELVRRHQGRIRLSSRPGAGSTFTVWLPFGPRIADPSRDGTDSAAGDFAGLMADEATHWVDRPATPDAGETARRSAGARILVVDDNADMRDYLSRLLGETWQVFTAADGEQALRLIARERIELVLADVLMPGMDGFELLRRIRADETTPWTPVMLVTARAGEETAVEGLLAGADDYIVKPFSARELVARAGAQIELGRLRRLSERRIRALIDASRDDVFRMSADWTELREIDGTGRSDASWPQLHVHPDDQAEVTAAVQEAIRTRSAFEREHRVRRADGSLGRTLSRAVPVLDDDGEIIEWVGVATDITGHLQKHRKPV